jgi:hypothetical protein
MLIDEVNKHPILMEFYLTDPRTFTSEALDVFLSINSKVAATIALKLMMKRSTLVRKRENKR